MNLDIYKNGIKKVIENNKLDKIKNTNILVVGCNGLIGSAIVDVLNVLNTDYDYNIKIIGTIRNKNRILERFNQYNNIEIISYDVLDKLEYDKKVDYVINTASPADPKSFSTNPVGVMNINYNGTKNILEYCLNNKVERLLYVSSGEIYGQAREDIESFDENYSGSINSTNFRSCYPISKLAAETLCSSYKEQYGMDVVIARPCHTYGPTMQRSDSRASSQFMWNVIDGNNIIMKSEGKQVRSYTYVLDCVTGLLNILINGINGEAYNVANNNAVVSIRELAETISKEGKRRVIFEIPSDKEKKSYNPVTRSVLNGTKLENIGWIPCYNVDDGVKETIDVLNGNKVL